MCTLLDIGFVSSFIDEVPRYKTVGVYVGRKIY